MNREQWLIAIRAKRIRIEPNNEATCDGKAATISPDDAPMVAKALGGTLPTVKIAATLDVPCCCALDDTGQAVAVWRSPDNSIRSGSGRAVTLAHSIHMFRGEHVRLVLTAKPTPKPAPKPVPKKVTVTAPPPKEPKSTPEKPADKKAPRASVDAEVRPKERKRERAPSEKAKDSGEK